MNRRNVTFFVLVVFLCWNVMTYFFIAYKPQGKEYDSLSVDVSAKVAELEQKLEEQAELHEELLRQLENIRTGIIQDILKKHPEEVEKAEEADEVERLRANPVAPSLRPIAPPKTSFVKRPSHRPTTTATNKPNLVTKSERLLPPPGIGGGDRIESLEGVDPDTVVLPVLVIACNRVSVNRNLDQLIKYRPSAERFPIVVSQDCGDKNTAEVIRSYGNQLTHIQHPDLSAINLPTKEKKFLGYHKIARHYKWALNQIFSTLDYKAVIIVEDDLNISQDFFEYFAATFRILLKDPTLWCVSAWNDNGKATMVNDDAELLYRTDFFPGLGWMLTKDTWLELEENWPKTFWDDWMRHPDQRKDRACIRPEISRTNTFGKIGVSKGQFFEKHLKYIKLNDKFVPFTKMDLSYLEKENYDEAFARKVYSVPLLSLTEVLAKAKPEAREVRVQYSDKEGFKKMAKPLGIMEDLKSGVPRAGYRGIVSFMKDGRRIYFAPPPDWKAYNKDWN